MARRPNGSSSRRPARRPRLGVEHLEDRTAPAVTVTLTGQPTWTFEGPAIVQNAQTLNTGDALDVNPVAGAVSAVAIHPMNRNIAYIGTANGGVWKTENFLAPKPTWTTSMGAQTSLAVGTLAIDP